MTTTKHPGIEHWRRALDLLDEAIERDPSTNARAAHVRQAQRALMHAYSAATAGGDAALAAMAADADYALSVRPSSGTLRRWRDRIRAVATPHIDTSPTSGLAAPPSAAAIAAGLNAAGVKP